MQLRLLNFYRIIATFATSILGAFIALIIYQSTQSFSWAFAYLAVCQIVKMLLHKVLNKFCQKRPQLMLLLRTFPVLFYSLSLLLLDTNVKILGILLITIFESLSDVMGTISVDYIFSYNSTGKPATSTGFSRLMEISGTVIAILVGGILLDNIDKWIIIMLACTVYLMSVIPLCVYAFKNRFSTSFNKESTSNATESYNTNDLKRHQHKYISKTILSRYFSIYTLECFFDAIMVLVSLYLFKENAEVYSYVSYIQVSFYALYGIGGMVAGFFDQKKDLTIFVVFSCIICGACAIISPFAIKSIVGEIFIYGIMGFFLSFISMFLYSRMMTRCKILGVSNIALTNRMQSSRLSRSIVSAICIPGTFMFIPAFFAIGIASILCSYAIPTNEEVVRKYLVDYLQNNGMY